MNTTSLKHEYLTVAEIKAYLNISQAKAYELTRRKDFPVCRLGSCIRIPRAAFLSWVQQMMSCPETLSPVA